MTAQNPVMCDFPVCGVVFRELRPHASTHSKRGGLLSALSHSSQRKAESTHPASIYKRPRVDMAKELIRIEGEGRCSTFSI